MGVHPGFPVKSELFDNFEKDVRELKSPKELPKCVIPSQK
jgi:hypothetical protein